MKEVPMFQTTDGLFFQDRAEAAERERELKNIAKVDKWIEGLELKPATATRTKKAIIAYLTANPQE